METPIPHSDIIGLPVETKSGEHLGKVARIDLIPDQHLVFRYAIRPSNPLKELVTDDLLIAPEQVLSLTKDKMVVDDLTSDAKKPAPAGAPASSV
jgi:sporulation protein YlmC with PRC-barrel domain